MTIFSSIYSFLSLLLCISILLIFFKGKQQVKSNFGLNYVIVADISVAIWKNTNLKHSGTVL